MEQKLDQLKQQYFSVNYKKRILIVGLIAAVILAILWSLNVGPAKVNLSTVWKAIMDLFKHNPELSNGERVIVMRVRIPRIAASMLVGVLLANSGLLVYLTELLLELLWQLFSLPDFPRLQQVTSWYRYLHSCLPH